MEYRLFLVHNGRRSKRWIRYSVMEQLHQRIKSDTRGLTFPRKISCCAQKQPVFYSRPNAPPFRLSIAKGNLFCCAGPDKRQSGLNKYFVDVVKRRPKFGIRPSGFLGPECGGAEVLHMY
jgi:hypothetical protein